MVENNVGKGENAGYQLFLLFPQCFQKFLLVVVENQDCVVKTYQLLCLTVCSYYNYTPHNHEFQRPHIRSLLKTL